MFTSTFFVPKQFLKLAILGTIFGTGLFMSSVLSASAQVPPVQGTNSLSQLEILIAQLRAQLSLLNSNAGTSSATLKIGSVVETTDVLRVRTAPSPTAKFLGSQPQGVKGIVVDGPIRAEGHTWLKVDYETGFDGWNAAGWLKQKTSYAGEVETPTTCVYNQTTYAIGDKKEMVLGSSTEKAIFECISGRWRLDTSSSSVTYIFTDTLSIKKQIINPIGRAVDDEYTLYTIELKNSTVHKIKVFGNQSPSVRDMAFRKTGYVGSIKYLTDRAQLVTEIATPVVDPKPVATSTKPTPVPPISDPRPTPTPKPDPKPIDKACVSEGKTYKEGDKVTSVTVDGKTKTISDGKFVCRKNVWEVEGNPNPKPVPTPVIVKKPKCEVLVSDAVITVGSVVRLTWAASNAVSGIINNGIGEINPDNKDGFREVKPVRDTTYVMTVENSKGEQVTCSKEVLVTPKSKPVIIPVIPIPPNKPITKGDCSSDNKEYKFGDKITTSTIGGNTLKVYGGYYICVKDKAMGSVWDFVSDPKFDAKRYQISDVKSVTKQLFIGKANFPADDYFIYKVTLKNNIIHTIKVLDYGTLDERQDAVMETGFTGEFTNLLNMAKIVQVTPTVKGAATDILTEIQFTLRKISESLSEAK